MPWYVTFVKTGKEALVEKCIQKFFDRSVCSALVPKKNLIEKRQGVKHQITRVIFPGYVFVNIKMSYTYYYKFKFIPKFYYILRTGECYYTEIGEHEIELILRLLNGSDTVDLSKAFVLGSKIEIIDGPLKHNEGIIQKVNMHKNRATVLVDFMNTEVSVDLGLDFIWHS